MYILPLGGDSMEFKKFTSSVRRKLSSVGSRLGQFFRFRKGNLLDQLFRISVIFLGLALVVGWVSTRFMPNNTDLQSTNNLTPEIVQQDLSKAVRAELEFLLASEYSWLTQPVSPVILGSPVDPPESSLNQPDPQTYRAESVEPVEEVLAISFDRILWPVRGEIETYYGWYRHPVSKDWRFNSGLAFDTATEEQIRSVLDGVVQTIEPGVDGFKLVIEHGSGWHSVYQGIRSIAVGVGDRVSQNQRIANSGLNGEMFFALHYEGEPVDPLQYMVTY